VTILVGKKNTNFARDFLFFHHIVVSCDKKNTSVKFKEPVMRYGILTFHRALNFGALLQTYGLQKAIEKFGEESEVIDYRCRYLENHYDQFLYLKKLQFRVLLYHLLKNQISIPNKKAFRIFTEKYIISSREIYEQPNELQNIDYNYKSLIVGSDQIWNYNQTNFDKSYFLDFVIDRRKKNAYAASFGFEFLPLNYESEYKKLLNSFNNLSVRESHGAEIIKKLLGVEVPVVLDPTMLLTKDEWSSISVESTNKENYILIYLLAESESIFQAAQNLSRKTGYKVVYINDKIIKRKKLKNIISIGPCEWLGLIKNAKYLFTNSFHGVAFAINFGIDFFVELLPPPSKVNSRLLNILNLFDLNNRLIKQSDVNNLILSDIDHTKVDRLLEWERLNSLHYLENVIKDVK
jgi:hypothetical protein